MEWIQELIYNSMLFSSRKFVEEIVNQFMGSLVSLREVGLDILDNDYFTSALLYVQGISLLLLMTKVAFEAKAIHTLRLDGNPDADPVGLLKGTVVSTAVIACLPWIVRYVWIFGLSVQRDVSQLRGSDIGTEQDSLIAFFNNMTVMPGVLFIGVLVAVIVYLLVMLQSLVFAVDLTIISVMGFWMALGLTNQQSNSFSVWWKDLQGTALIPGLQLLILKGAFVFWGSLTSLDPGERLLLFIVFMYGAYRVPQKVQSYVGFTSSGLGRTSVGMAQTVLTRMLYRR